MNEFTNDEMQKIKEAIAEFNHYGDMSAVDIDEWTITRTHETTDDFKSSGNWSDIERDSESGNGWSVDIISDYQFKKGEPRKDIYIVDLGNIRAGIQ